MAPARTSWTWGRGESCDIRDGEITVAQDDPWGGAGAELSEIPWAKLRKKDEQNRRRG